METRPALSRHMNAEQLRVQRNSRSEEAWDLWGPYLSERAWGTVREDYSANGRRGTIFHSTMPARAPSGNSVAAGQPRCYYRAYT